MTRDDSCAGFSILSREVLSANPWFSVLRSQVRAPSGRELTYFSVKHARPAVGIVARRAGQVLLIRQYRLLIDEMVWAIPSGGCEQGEATEQAARRELLEETGQRATDIRPLQRYYPSYGVGDQQFVLFEATVTEDAPLCWDEDEVLEARWFSEAEVGTMARDGRIVDGLSLTPLLLLCARERW